jgi:hypothetical protein
MGGKGTLDGTWISLSCSSGIIVLVHGRKRGGGVERKNAVLTLGVSMRRKLYSSVGRLIGPALVQTRAIDLLIHDDGVRKFASESDYYLPSFKELDKVRWGRGR